MDPRNCKHGNWADDTQVYEETKMFKCGDCGLFIGSDEPNPNYDPIEADKQHLHDFEVARARAERKGAKDVSITPTIAQKRGGPQP